MKNRMVRLCGAAMLALPAIAAVGIVADATVAGACPTGSPCEVPIIGQVTVPEVGLCTIAGGATFGKLTSDPWFGATADSAVAYVNASGSCQGAVATDIRTEATANGVDAAQNRHCFAASCSGIQAKAVGPWHSPGQNCFAGSAQILGGGPKPGAAYAATPSCVAG